MRPRGEADGNLNLRRVRKVPVTESSRELTGETLDIQARMLGLDLSVVDADGLLERERAGLEDVDRLDELCLGKHEPSVTFDTSRSSQ